MSVAHAKGKLLLAHRQTEAVWGWVLVPAGSAKVRNVGGNQLRLSAGSAEVSGLRLPFGSYSTRRFALRGNPIQIYHKTESEQIEMPESQWLRTLLTAGLNIGSLVHSV